MHLSNTEVLSLVSRAKAFKIVENEHKLEPFYLTLKTQDPNEPYSSVNLKLARAEGFALVARAIEDNPRIALKAWREEDYYADQAQAAALTRRVGMIAALLMGIGAVFGAMNTMYAAVAGRARDVGTLLAVGFRRNQVMASFLFESTLIGLAGGLVGLVPALLFHGQSAALVNFRSFTEVQFTLTITPRVFLEALGYALAMGLVGGLFPAYRAASLVPAVALREL
jgi:putative ABC transport system permease protein